MLITLLITKKSSGGMYAHIYVLFVIGVLNGYNDYDNIIYTNQRRNLSV